MIQGHYEYASNGTADYHCEECDWSQHIPSQDYADATHSIGRHRLAHVEERLGVRVTEEPSPDAPPERGKDWPWDFTEAGTVDEASAILSADATRAWRVWYPVRKDGAFKTGGDAQ